jgi:hypothetical protein
MIAFSSFFLKQIYTNQIIKKDTAARAQQPSSKFYLLKINFYNRPDKSLGFFYFFPLIKI